MKRQSRPKNGNGREAVGPHASRTGWSYWVTIPSWDVRRMSKDSDPDVVCSVHVDLRSPEGITKTRRMLKKFRDFEKLLTDLVKKFPNNEVLRSLKTPYLLNKEICTLEEWITKLLSDIDLSRSFEVESFLELEAFVSTFYSENQDVNPQNSEANSHVMPTQSNLPTILGSSSIKSDYGSDTAYEKAEPGTPRIRKDENSEIDVNVVGKDVHVGSTSGTSLLSDGSISRLGGAEASSSMDILGNFDLCGSGDAQPFLRLDMVKTDMKYLEARPEQETAVRIYHEAKIKEFEEEQEIDRQKIEALNQVLTTEEDKNILLRWEMYELRLMSFKMQSELEAKSEREELLLRELSSNKQQQENVSKQYKKKNAECEALNGEVKRLCHKLQKLEEEKSEAENSPSANTAFKKQFSGDSARGGSSTPRGGRGGRGRGGPANRGGNKPVCQIYNKAGQTAVKCYGRFEGAESSDQSSPTQANVASISDAGWYVDSGATNHVTSDLANPSLKADYKGKNKLVVGPNFGEGPSGGSS